MFKVHAHYMKRRYKISELDSSTSTLIVYDIGNRALHLFDCEIEL